MDSDMQFNFISFNSSSIWYFVGLIFVLYGFLLLSRYQKKQLRNSQSHSSTPSTRVITSQDIKAIAGDDVMATQLDLARAYLEMNKKSLAKKILTHVEQNGTQEQRRTATQLMTQL
jgi:FimV-like protein